MRGSMWEDWVDQFLYITIGKYSNYNSTYPMCWSSTVFSFVPILYILIILKSNFIIIFKYIRFINKKDFRIVPLLHQMCGLCYIFMHIMAGIMNGITSTEIKHG